MEHLARSSCFVTLASRSPLFIMHPIFLTFESLIIVSCTLWSKISRQVFLSEEEDEEKEEAWGAHLLLQIMTDFENPSLAHFQ